MENKILIIDEIVKRHPAYGVEKGWSCYVGGMKDSGEWYFRKMLDCQESELQEFLDYILSEEAKPIQELTEEEKTDSKKVIWFDEKHWANELDFKRMTKFNNDIEAKIFS